MADLPTGQHLGHFVLTSVGGETVRAFVPPALPPSPEIRLLSLMEPLGRAERALGRLDGITMLLPNRELC